MKKVVLVHGVSCSPFFIYILNSFCLVSGFLSETIMDLSELINCFFPPIEWKDGVPLWEKKFCSLVGTIPWGKIVDTKNIMFCHKNILSWDDSAGEEALQNAKKRFWAKMNNLPCEISPPDPDVYIDKIDWNTKIDHELIKELDQVYFAPDEGEENSNLGYKNKRIKKSVSVPSEGHYMNQENNPWECNNMQGSGALKNKAQGWECNNMQDSGTLNVNAQGWKLWEDNKNDLKVLNDDNDPWGRSFTQGNGGMVDNGWGNCVDKVWGLKQVGNVMNQWDHGNNPWGCGYQGVVSVEDKGWGDFGNKGRGWNRQERKNLDNGDHPWESRSRWNNCGGGNGWGGKQWDETNNELKRRAFSRTGGGRGTWNEGSQKRGSSRPHEMSNKSYRFQDDANQTSQSWRRGQTRKRVNFAPGYQ